MTYSQAISQLESMVIEGSQDLLPATEILPSIPRHTVYGMIAGEKLPAVKLCGHWVSEKSIFTEFFKRTLRPTKRTHTEPVVGFKENRKAQIEEAIAQVKGTRR